MSERSEPLASSCSLGIECPECGAEYRVPDPLLVVECPWPDDVWTMTEKEYVEVIPDDKLRTAISGFLMRKGWEVAITQIKEENERNNHE